MGSSDLWILHLGVLIKNSSSRPWRAPPLRPSAWKNRAQHRVFRSICSPVGTTAKIAVINFVKDATLFNFCLKHPFVNLINSAVKWSKL